MKKLPTLHVPDITQREALLHRIERLTELPLMILAFAMIPLLVGPLLWELSQAEEATKQLDVAISGEIVRIRKT